MDGAASRHRRKDKVVVIMGATGSGKSRLSVELATLFPFSEIINSDKMQVYRGLDITTNKIPFRQRNGVPHHLLGDVDPSHGEFSPSDFRRRAGDLISDITSRRKLPIIVGGSNSFIHALLVERFDPESNIFGTESSSPLAISSELRYKCCFLWVDISFPVLSDAEGWHMEQEGGDLVREGAYEEAVRAIKDNTCKLAKRQKGKIMWLKRAGWDLRRIDATEAFRAVLTTRSRGGGECSSNVWKRVFPMSGLKKCYGRSSCHTMASMSKEDLYQLREEMCREIREEIQREMSLSRKQDIQEAVKEVQREMFLMRQQEIQEAVKETLQFMGVGSSHAATHDCCGPRSTMRESTKGSCSLDDDENQPNRENFCSKMRLLKGNSFFVDLEHDCNVFEWFAVDKKDIDEVSDGKQWLSSEVLSV